MKPNHFILIPFFKVPANKTSHSIKTQSINDINVNINDIWNLTQQSSFVISADDVTKGAANYICNSIFYLWTYKLWHNSNENADQVLPYVLPLTQPYVCQISNYTACLVWNWHQSWMTSYKTQRKWNNSDTVLNKQQAAGNSFWKCSRKYLHIYWHVK